jgi:predicted DNA-binding transcriptional regulator AlpA
MIFKDVIGFYTVDDICRILNIARATFYRLYDDPEANFPRSNKLTTKDKAHPRWWIPAVHEWIRNRLKEEVEAPSRHVNRASARTGHLERDKTTHR